MTTRELSKHLKKAAKSAISAGRKSAPVVQVAAPRCDTWAGKSNRRREARLHSYMMHTVFGKQVA